MINFRLGCVIVLYSVFVYPCALESGLWSMSNQEYPWMFGQGPKYSSTVKGKSFRGETRGNHEISPLMEGNPHGDK